MRLSRVLVVTKRTAYETYAEDRRSPRFSSLALAGDKKVRALYRSHDEHCRTLEAVEKAFDRRRVSVEQIPRGARFDDAAYDLVVAVGGDGTFIAVAHHVRETPLLGVNSAPKDSIGFFCGAARQTLDRVLDRILRDTLPAATLQRLQAEIDGAAVAVPVLNEVLYAHENPAALARYMLRVPGAREEQKSSGIWVAAPAGSGGAVGSAGGRRLALEAHRFQFVVREPYERRGRKIRHRKGVLGAGDALEIESHIGRGKIFIDGSHVAHDVTFGTRVKITLSRFPLRALGLRKAPRTRRG
jgi:NAD+ kinase